MSSFPEYMGSPKGQTSEGCAPASGADKGEEELKSSNMVSRSEVVEDRNAYTVVREGQAEVLFPSSKDVFYNPVQEFNRDVSVAVLRLLARQHQEETGRKQRPGDGTEGVPESRTQLTPGVKCETGIRILEALAASGLRSCRFAKEVGGVKHILANDLSPAAVDAMRRNIEHNRVTELVEPHQGDASLLMYSLKKDRYDVIDLDPYGSPTGFLDSAVQAVTDGGVLQVTCTDLAVLCGNAPETCHAKYGAVSVRSKMCHEMALRIALQCIESHANRYGRYIEPLLSLSIDFYIRLFVRVRSSQAKVKLSASKMSHVYVCSGCGSWVLQPKCRVSWNKNNPKFHLPVPPPNADRCQHCSFTTHMCGPIWSEPIHSEEFVGQLLESLVEDELGTYKRLLGVISVIQEELPDVPLYYDAERLASACRMSVPPALDLRSALLNAGHRVSGSHCSAAALKTDAPAEFVWGVMRAWEQRHPVKRQNLAAGSPAVVLLSEPPPEGVSFTRHPQANPSSRQKQLRRFQQNPQPNWGPKAKAKTSISQLSLQEKRSRNQRKKRRTREDASSSPDPAGREEPSSKKEKLATEPEQPRESEVKDS